MKEGVQNSINQIKRLAKDSLKTASPHFSAGKNDNLLKSVRNHREASIFLNELKAAIKTARLK